MIQITRLCSSVLLLFLQIGYTLSSTTTTTPRPGSMLRIPVEGDALAPESWRSVSDIPVKDCPHRWTCDDYNPRRMYLSKRSHYDVRSCACDDLCLLLQDCCPDAPVVLAVFNSDSPGDTTASGLQGHETSARIPSASGDRNSPSHSVGSEGEPRAGLPTGSDRVKSASDVRSPSQSFSSSLSTPKLSPPGSSSSSSSSSSSLPRTNRTIEHPEKSTHDLYGVTMDMLSCVSVKEITETDSVSMVTSCPADYSEDVEMRQQCHNVSKDDMMTLLPVSGKVTRLLYRNMFCALCHREPFVYWTAGANCSSKFELPYNENSTLDEVLYGSASNYCDVYFQPPWDLYQWRPCKGNVIRKCSQNFSLDTVVNKEIASRCEETDVGIQRPVRTLTRTYRNQYCALCNFESIVGFICEPEYSATTLSTDTRARYPYSFSILLDINTYSGSTSVGRKYEHQTVERNESVSCDQGQVFDPFRATCRPVTCGPHRQFKDNACVDNELSKDVKASSPGFLGDVARLNKTSDLLVTSDCVFIRLNQTEYQLSNDGTLELIGTDTFYNTSHYVINGSDVFVCVNYSQNYTQTVTTRVQNATFTFSLTEAVISTCGICISLVALAVTIFVYASLKPLRNIPGQNLLSLVCSLFLADVLLLVAPSAGEEFVACAVIAGLMHYCFLSSFLWMNVMAVDVWFTFSKAFVKAGDRGKSSKRFIIYSSYAWLTPAAFVLSAVLLQVLKPDSSLSPRYGLGICWLANKHALLLFFAAPLFLLLLLNIIFFLISARNISRAKSKTARMLGKDEEGRMGIYVKLTVVMGITWVFGFLAVLVPNNQVLTYCFVVMNTLQGLFICLSFVFTKKVLHLLKDNNRRKLRISKSGGSTNMTSLSKSLSTSNRNIVSVSTKISHNVVV
ncbi:uncharacterized protein [Littorina saxatilis]